MDKPIWILFPEESKLDEISKKLIKRMFFPDEDKWPEGIPLSATYLTEVISRDIQQDQRLTFNKTIVKTIVSAMAVSVENKIKANAKKHKTTVISPGEFFDSYALTLKELQTILSNLKGQERYIPIPSEAVKMAPSFTLGLKKNLKPEYSEDVTDIWDGKGKTHFYFSLKTKKTDLSIQYTLFEDQDVTTLEAYEKNLRMALGPRRLLVFYSLLADCDDNRNQDYFYLDINKDLDRLGYKRDSKGQHLTNNRDRLREDIEKLTGVSFNFVSYAQDPKSKEDLLVTRIHGPVISITGYNESYRASKDNPGVPKSKVISNGMQIFIAPELRKLMNSKYTKFPEAYFQLDTGRQQHWPFLYSHINNQWLIGWHSYHGTMTSSLASIIKNSGVPMPIRKNNQLPLVKKIISDLKEMEKDKRFWIESLTFDPPVKPLTGKTTELERLLAQVVTIKATKNHPIRESMKDYRDITNYIESSLPKGVTE
jgi:hypothetical protein